MFRLFSSKAGRHKGMPLQRLTAGDRKGRPYSSKAIRRSPNSNKSKVRLSPNSNLSSRDISKSHWDKGTQEK